VATTSHGRGFDWLDRFLPVLNGSGPDNVTSFDHPSPLLVCLSVLRHWVNRCFHPPFDLFVGESTIDLVSTCSSEKARRSDRVFCVRNSPISISMLDQPSLFETLECRPDASLWNVDNLYDLSLSKGVIRIFEEEAVNPTLCRVR
jgi:hypothetical protein